MSKFIFAYYGGNTPSTEEEGAENMKKWGQWLNDLGAAAINPGSPLPTTKIVTAKGVKDKTTQDGMNGFSIFQAVNYEEAIKMAQSCPFLEIDGVIEVSEMMKMG